ncbi:MAG: CHAT domain-containing protein, partial [bacterium]
MEAIRYLDFDLLIDRFGKKYKARVINSPAGQAASEFDAPFSVGELQEFWSKLESCLQKKAASPSDCKPILKKFGGQLFATVFAGYVRSSFGACLNEASHQGAGLRLRLRLSEAPELAALPWEFLHDPSTNRFLSLSNQTPIVRYLDLPERIKPLAVQPPLRMLVMVASPWDLPPLEVEQEWQNVKNALAEAERKKLVQLECLETATLSTLQKRLREMPFHLFHFIGHGDFDEAAQTGVLYLENEDKKKRAVSGDE